MADDLDLTHPFANFLYAFGAARKLLERAQEEGIVVYVSLIDGLLRMSLVLDKQLVRQPHFVVLLVAAGWPGSRPPPDGPSRGSRG